MSERDDNQSDRIDRYVLGKMSSDEALAFEKEISQNADLRKKVEDITDLEAVLSLNEFEKLKKGLRTEKSSKMHYWYIAAASIALLFVATFVIYNMSLGSDSEDIYLSYFKPYPNIIDAIDRSDKSTMSAYQLYEIGNYEEALRQLEKTDSDPALFYKAQILMIEGKSFEAITLYKKISKKSKFYEASRWYLALALIREDDFEKAALILKEMKDDYNSRAQELLSKIE